MNAAIAIAPAMGVTALEPLANRIGISGILLLTAGIGAATILAIWVQGLGRKPIAAEARN
jgi:hypothetical protein